MDRTARNLSAIQRFPITHTIRKQTVAEHCFQVARIVMLLRSFIPKSTYRAAIDYALIHDDIEVITADIPSTAKRAGYVKTDDETMTTIVQGTPSHMLDPLVKATVKLADMSEAAIFCMEELAMGNKLIKGVLADILKNYSKALDNFVSASGADREAVKERTLPPFKKGTFDFEYYIGNLL